MYFDAFTVSALVDEFLDLLAGGRIQDVIDVDEYSVGLEIYAERRRHYLLISADPNLPRVYIVDQRLRRGVMRSTQLGLLLRRLVEGGRLAHISQPPWERVLELQVEGPEGAVDVIIEAMERRSNILLVRDGVILDCIRRVGPQENRVRVSLPGHVYVPPPPLTDRLYPADVTADSLQPLLDAAAQAKRKAQQVLSANILGVSPLLAREIVFRAGYAVDAQPGVVDADRLVLALHELVDPLLQHDWQPGIVSSAGRPQAFSVYPLTHLPGWEIRSSVSSALAEFYAAAVSSDAYHAAKAAVLEAAAEVQARLRARLTSLQRSMTDEDERERLRRSGELILAYQNAIQPGQTELRAAYSVDSEDMVIALDPELTPVENAQRYFDRYQRSKRALDEVPTLIEAAERDLAFLEQLIVDLQLAESWPEIDEVQAQLQARGWLKQPRQNRPGGQRSAPLRMVTDDGFVIWVGRSSRQNELVTFEKGGPSDLWLHARGVPGAHVIIKTDGRPVPDAVVQRAAQLAAYFSARREELRVDVDITLRQHVRKIKGGADGQVTYRNERTISVQPQPPQPRT
jgi:predicted ribosome quality control (RQC) complex YloA/Tae2 family protein